MTILKQIYTPEIVHYLMIFKGQFLISLVKNVDLLKKVCDHWQIMSLLMYLPACIWNDSYKDF